MSTKDRSDQGIQPLEDRTDLGVGQLGMVVEGVAGVLAAAGLPAELALLLAELGCGPDIQGSRRQGLPALTDSVPIPALQLTQALIQAQRTGAEAAFLVVALVQEGPIAEFGVVAGEGEIAEAMQPLLLHLGPTGAEGLTPGG